MLQLEFSEADKHALNHERYHHPHPRVQQRMEALWLKSQGLPHQRIATLCAISGNTLRAYLKLYQAGGMEALKQLNFYRRFSQVESAPISRDLEPIKPTARQVLSKVVSFRFTLP